MLSKLNFSLSENTKYGIYFLIIFFGCILIYIQAIQPLNFDTSVLKTNITLNNNKLAQLQTFKGQTPDYDALQNIQKLKLAQGKKKIPDKISVPQLVGEYSKLANANSISLLSLEPKTYIKAGNAFGLPVEMNLSGDYFHLINFLQQAENADRFVNLQSVRFTAQKNDIIDLTAEFIVYALNSGEVAVPDKTNKTKK